MSGAGMGILSSSDVSACRRLEMMSMEGPIGTWVNRLVTWKLTGEYICILQLFLPYTPCNLQFEVS